MTTDDKCEMCLAFVIAGHKTCACVEVSKVPQIRKSIIDELKQVMEGDDYDRGALEAARAQANNATLMVSRLIALLIEKNVVSEIEIKHISKSFYY